MSRFDQQIRVVFQNYPELLAETFDQAEQYRNVTSFGELCERCGACCRHLDTCDSTELAALDRGDGVCLHLDAETGLCRQYHERPLECCIDRFVEQVSLLDRSQFFAFRRALCRKMQEM